MSGDSSHRSSHGTCKKRRFCAVKRDSDSSTSNPVGVAISSTKREPFPIQHRRAIGIGAAAAVAVLFAVHVVHWHLPYRIASAVVELPLLGVALGAGLAAGLILPRVTKVFARFGAWPTAAFVALIVFLLVQAADPFVRERSWLYAPARCDHAIEFPRRPSIVSGEAVSEQKRRSVVERARHVDVGEATTFTAECLDFGAEIGAEDRARMIEAAEAQLKRAAALLRLKVERTARGDGTVTLAGYSDEGRNAANEPLLRRAEARAVLGRSSLLVLWAWSVGGEGAQLPPSVARFFASVRPASAR